MKRKLLLTIVCMTISAAAAQMMYAEESPITPDGTYLYAERDTCDLYLDVYNPAKGSQTSIDGKMKPTIVFMFGGGFIGGARDDASYNHWFRTLTRNGYRVISIDYRLGLKGSNKVGIAQVNVLDKAIHMAVEDLFSATAFMIDNAEALGIDPENIVVSGSSAGAISVMQAEYEICNSTSWTEVLPEGFNYSGVMSFSGAILSRKGKVKYAKEPCPRSCFTEQPTSWFHTIRSHSSTWASSAAESWWRDSKSSVTTTTCITSSTMGMRSPDP